MKILGLLATYRRQGNSEVFVKEALRGAEEEGAEVEVLRLTNYHIRSCTGCARCHTGLNPCHLKDDFNGLLQQVYGYDGIILGSPVYYLTAPAVLKLFMDRLVCEGYPIPLYGKPAALVMTYGNRGFHPYAFTLPNSLFLKWGMKVVDRASIHSASPGDAMLDEVNLGRCKEMGRAVARAARTGRATYQGEPGICPVCNDSIVRILKDRRTVICPTCGIRGHFVVADGQVQVVFTEEEAKEGRYSPEQWYRHHMYHVELGQEWFMATKDQRKAKREEYRNYPPAKVAEPAGD